MHNTRALNPNCRAYHRELYRARVHVRGRTARACKHSYERTGVFIRDDPDSPGASKGPRARRLVTSNHARRCVSHCRAPAKRAVGTTTRGVLHRRESGMTLRRTSRAHVTAPRRADRGERERSASAAVPAGTTRMCTEMRAAKKESQTERKRSSTGTRCQTVEQVPPG